jgi:hypothetical protein
MNSENGSEPVLFAKRFLGNAGAVLEETQGGFEALLPSDLSERLGIREHIQVEEETEVQEEGRYTINYGSPLLEKMVEIACARIPVATCRLSFDYLKSQGFDRLIHGQFSFVKSTFRIISSAVVKTEYLILTCRYLAQSDEQKQGLLTVAFHCDTGARVPQMDATLSLAARSFSILSWQRDAGSLEKILRSMRVDAEELLKEVLLDFRGSMNRRFRRDVKSLGTYYAALRKEMEGSLQRPGLSEQLIQDRMGKIALISDEMARKKDDLFNKYSIRIKIAPCAGMLVHTPAVKVLVEILAGRAKKQISLLYNPVTKCMDPLVCQGCGRSMTGISFCDRLHLLCAQCHRRCPLC